MEEEGIFLYVLLQSLHFPIKVMMSNRMSKVYRTCEYEHPWRGLFFYLLSVTASSRRRNSLFSCLASTTTNVLCDRLQYPIPFSLRQFMSRIMYPLEIKYSAARSSPVFPIEFMLRHKYEFGKANIQFDEKRNRSKKSRWIWRIIIFETVTDNKCENSLCLR